MVNKEAARSNDCVVPSHLCVCALPFVQTSMFLCFVLSFRFFVCAAVVISVVAHPLPVLICVCLLLWLSRRRRKKKNPLLFPCRGKRGRGSTPSGRLVVSQCAALDPSVSVSTFLCTSAIVPNSFRMPCHHDP